MTFGGHECILIMMLSLDICTYGSAFHSSRFDNVSQAGHWKLKELKGYYARLLYVI